MADPAPQLEGPDVYPWEWPTDAQKAYFDALPVDKQWRLVDEMLEEAFNSGPGRHVTMEEIIAQAKARRRAEGL
jgi:hypothetical protein